MTLAQALLAAEKCRKEKNVAEAKLVEALSRIKRLEANIRHLQIELNKGAK